MNRPFGYSLILILFWMLPQNVPVSIAQEGPPKPVDTSAFRGNLFTTLQQQPLAYDKDISVLPLLNSLTSSATLIQVRQGVKSHYHAKHDEIVYVLSGKGVMTVEGETQAIKAGDLILMRRGVAHSVINKSAQPLVALSVMSPPFGGQDRIFTE